MKNNVGAGTEPRRSRLQRVGRWTGVAVLLLLLLLGAAVAWGWWSLRGSLPPLVGEVGVDGLEAPVAIERDVRGVPVLRGSSRRDLALATGYVHGQDRFFQMDLFRRQAAGELGELLGRRARNTDAGMRIHRLRNTARRALAAEPPARRALVSAYAAGVNAGLASLRERPFEYLVLRAEPEPWKAEDTYLVILAMFLQLQDEEGEYEVADALLQECLPPELYRFLTPEGTEWDSAIDSTFLGRDDLPRDQRNVAVTAAPRGAQTQMPDDAFVPGSNAWAVAGTRTADGRALLANDMHLGLNLPVIWYRASLVWTPGDGIQRRVTGITLPGAPVVVAGSNGRVAWGFTNAQIDTSDLVVWEPGEADGESYATPGGRAPYRRYEEVLRFKNGDDESLKVLWTRWGPVLEEDWAGRRRAIRWVAHEPEAVNLGLIGLEESQSVDDAVEVANRSGMPAQNLLAADRDGRIAWSIAGRLPRRIGFNGSRSGSWADGNRRWEGWLEPAEYPRIIDPESGLLWSGNQRMVGGAMLAKLGDGGYTLGARAAQIRDRLQALPEPHEGDMLAVQLDDEAIFLNRWRDLFLEVLDREPEGAGDPRRREARELVERWDGHASVDSAGYPVIRWFRITLAQQVFDHLTRACKEIDPDFVYRTQFHRYEGPLWRMIQDRPLHLLSPEHESWDEQLFAAIDGALDYLVAEGGPLADQTWGRRNTLAIRHPLAGLPLLGSLLEMPARQVPGDNYMPRVQHPSAGASQRLVVSPGHEDEGFFHMPGGQSGHPLSPHFDDHQEAWIEGAATPFLPGEGTRILILRPR